MQVLSLNIGQAQEYDWRGGTQSAIVKSPVTSANLTGLGFEGDMQCDLKHHGGVDKAVMLMPAQNYQILLY